MLCLTFRVLLLICSGWALPLPPPVPPRGWSTWNSLACNISEAIIIARIDALVSTRLAVAYKYVNIDDCWLACNGRDADGSCRDPSPGRDGVTGQLVADPVLFPRGIPYLAAYARARGLQLGMYVSAGNTTCSGYMGSWGHFDQDAATLVGWNASYVKIDGCGLSSDPVEGQRQRAIAYPALSRALRATNRSVIYSCDSDELLRDTNNTERPWLWAPGVCDLWRVSPDAKDDWSHVVNRVQGSVNLDAFAGPTLGYNDLDFLTVGQGAQTDAEYTAQFCLWTLLASPLLLGLDPVQLSAQLNSDATTREGRLAVAAANNTLALLLNPEILAIADDPLAAQAQRWTLDLDGTSEAWVRPLASSTLLSPDGRLGDPSINSSLAVGMWNRASVNATPGVWLQNLFGQHNGGRTYMFIAAVRDLLAHRDMEPAIEWWAPPEPLPPHGIGMYKFTLVDAICIDGCS